MTSSFDLRDTRITHAKHITITDRDCILLDEDSTGRSGLFLHGNATDFRKFIAILQRVVTPMEPANTSDWRDLLSLASDCIQHATRIADDNPVREHELRDAEILKAMELLKQAAENLPFAEDGGDLWNGDDARDAGPKPPPDPDPTLIF